jgi:hypothetical protein
MWERIITWFGDIRERKGLLRSFNYSARSAYTFGECPILLQASITLGRSNNRTSYSWLMSGFRIKTHMAGYYMDQSMATVIALIILSNAQLVRHLITLGFDTLEVGTEGGSSIYSWPLIRFALTS